MPASTRNAISSWEETMVHFADIEFRSSVLRILVNGPNGSHGGIVPRLHDGGCGFERLLPRRHLPLQIEILHRVTHQATLIDTRVARDGASDHATHSGHHDVANTSRDAAEHLAEPARLMGRS